MTLEDRYTNYELSRALAEKGCDLESEYVWYQDINGYRLGHKSIVREIIIRIRDKRRVFNRDFFCSYDLIHDICIKYSKEFWGERDICFPGKFEENAENVALLIRYLQQERKSDVEKIIRE